MKTSLTSHTFRFSSEDSRKLDCLVTRRKRLESGHAFGMRINRTSILQNLIFQEYLELQAEDTAVDSSIDRAKKKAKKGAKKVAESA